MPHDDSPGRSSGWVLDELAFAGRENLDDEHVSRYDEKEDAGAAAEVEILRRLGMNGDSLLVEVGAGTGQLSVAAAPLCGRVIAVDVSPPMLDRLRAKVAKRELGNVQVVRAGFLSYAHDADPADFAYSRLALHHLPDFWKAIALTRVRAFMRPGGVFRLVDVAYDFEPSEASRRIEAWRAAYPEAPAEGEWGRADVDEHVRDEHSTFTWVLEPMIERSGFEITDAAHSDEGIFASYVLRAV